MQEASQQRIAAFKAAAHLTSQPVTTHKGRKVVNIHASSRTTDISVQPAVAAGRARLVPHDSPVVFMLLV